MYGFWRKGGRWLVLDYDLLDGWMEKGRILKLGLGLRLGWLDTLFFVRLFCSGDLWRILGDFNRFLERSSL